MKNKNSLRKVKLRKGLVAVILTILIISSIIIFLIPFSYQASEFYNVQEPYIENVCEDSKLKSINEWGETNTECLNEICDSTRSVCVDTNWLGNCIEYQDRCTHYACTRYLKKCNYKISNIDNVYGVWKVQVYSRNGETNERKFIDSMSIGVQPTRTGVVKWQFSYDAGEDIRCSYGEITNPTKTDCDEKTRYETVQHERQIIKKDTWFNMIAKKTQYVFYVD